MQNKRYCVFFRQLSHGRKRHEKTDTRYAAVSGHAGLDSGAHQPADGDEHPRRHGGARRHRYGAYPDTNTYPTKFIYGQIAATGGRSAICCDPKEHGLHNLPKIVDIYNALTIPYDLAFPEEFASDDCLYAGDQIMVKFARGFRGKLNTTLVRAGITGLEKLMDTSTGVWYIASVTGDVQQVMANVRAVDNVVLAEYDFMYAAA